jgi:hypothetical protein
MKDSLKIALGIFLGLLVAGLCAVCIFFTVSLGGLAYLGSLIESPTVEATPTTISGYIRQCDDLGLSVVSYRISETCPDDSGQPAQGAKFVIVKMKAVNFTNDVLSLPSIEFRLNDFESGLGSTGNCFYNENAFGNACWQSNGKLFPGVSCQGWELFEVPVSLDVSTATLYTTFEDFTNNVSCNAQWLLENP